MKLNSLQYLDNIELLHELRPDNHEIQYGRNLSSRSLRFILSSLTVLLRQFLWFVMSGAFTLKYNMKKLDIIHWDDSVNNKTQGHQVLSFVANIMKFSTNRVMLGGQSTI